MVRNFASTTDVLTVDISSLPCLRFASYLGNGVPNGSSLGKYCLSICISVWPAWPNALLACPGTYQVAYNFVRHLISSVFTSCRAQPHAELSQTERSEALPREARPPPKAAGAVSRPGAEGDPRASRGLQTKARMRLNSMRFNAWRIHSLGRRESVLCTNGILTALGVST